MSKIQIVIEIDEDLYNNMKSRYKYQNETDDNLSAFEKIGIAIKNGTPLPKGNGELKDADAIHKEIERLQSGIAKNGGAVNISRDQYKGMCYARGIINEALTIIKADKDSEE